MFNFNKVTIDPQGHESPVVYLIRQEYLAEPEFIRIDVQSLVRVNEPTLGLDYSAQDLKTIGRDSNWQEKITDVSLEALHRHRRVIVFCPSVQSAEDCARVVADQGFHSKTILAGTPGEQRQDTIRAFRGRGSERMIIFNFGVLTAGFDAPHTGCVIVARPTTSLVLYSQMVGRAMRGKRSGGNRWCQIYTVADTNLRGFGSVVQAFSNWEELWRQAQTQ